MDLIVVVMTYRTALSAEY